MNLVPSEIRQYAELHTSEESKLLRQLEETTAENLEYPEMLSGRVVGWMLALLVEISGAQKVLEIGTFTGYSALSMARALPEDGKLITCEYNERYESIARTFFGKSEYGDKIELVMGNAMETIPELDHMFDLVFLDADKVNYPGYYKLVLPILNKGGLLVIDNVFWSGDVLDPVDEQSGAIDRLNKEIRDDKRVEQVILTVRDGVTIARKK